jgi:DNA-binding IclR family transcriptional regulator
MSEDGVAAVNRALVILGAFTKDDHSLTLAELAERTGYYKSTIMRLIESLKKFNYIRQLSNGAYQVGGQAARIGSIYRRQFRTHDHVPGVLQQIVKDMNESASFYIQDGDARICLHRADSSRPVRDHIVEGDRLSLQDGASGHVLVAFAHNAPNRGGKLGKVRSSFYSASFGERDPETAAIAVPVFGEGNVLQGALSISGPRYRFEALDVESVVHVLWKHARHLTSVFGGDNRIYTQSASPSRDKARAVNR